VSATVVVKVRPPFVPGPAERAFDATTYLDELLSLAERYLRPSPTATQGPTRAQLAAALWQPIDRWARPESYEDATVPVEQSRIAVEVLRGALGPPGLPSEQRFRGMAYHAFLLSLGTSYPELRQARRAPAALRVALANRLGVELSGQRPDRLDEITISPEEVTDAHLADVFGYLSAAPSRMLLSLRSGLATVWRREDEADRTTPVIDPDVMGEANLRGTDPADRARVLYLARLHFLAQERQAIGAAVTAGAGTLAGFDTVVRQFVGAGFDLPALAAADTAGEDIAAELAELGLSQEAFGQLVSLRSVFPDGALLAGEKDDLAEILLRVKKNRLIPDWFAQERADGIVLQPAMFLPDPPGVQVGAPRWRAEQSTVDEWRATLEARSGAAESLGNRYRGIIESVEGQVLPKLRDALLAEIGTRQSPPREAGEVADRLSRDLCLDFRAAGGQRITRVAQAIGSVQSLLVSARSGLRPGLVLPDEAAFDREWEWLVSHPRWASAMRAFAYPENHLHPNLFRAGEGSVPQGQLAPTQQYQDLITALVGQSRLTAAGARSLAATFVQALRTALGNAQVPLALKLTDQHTAASLAAHRALQDSLIPATVTVEEHVPQAVRELFWLAPMALARKLEDSRQYAAALDWYQTIFDYQGPAGQRKIYRGLELEIVTPADFTRFPGWLGQINLNPHLIARKRPGAYTRYTITSIVECVLGFADAEFARRGSDAHARARTLYQTATDLLALPEAAVTPLPQPLFPDNAFASTLKESAAAGLAKIHAGLDIGGLAAVSDGADSFLPSHYRYAALIERAKALVSTAQQVESAYLSALERADAESYNLLQAGHDLRIAAASVDLQEVKVAGADIGVKLAVAQRKKSEDLVAALGRRLSGGLNSFERRQLDSLVSAKQLSRQASFFGTMGSVFGAVSTMAAGGMINPYNLVAEYKSGQAELAVQDARIAEVRAGFARRQEEWVLQRAQAAADVAIGAQQVELAVNQRELAVRERHIAVRNRDHAAAVVEFLSTKFTNVELHEWMSGVLGRVYAYLLQQAAATAELAQAQLAFERQEPQLGFIALDYWNEAESESDPGDPANDRRGLTGSARLLQDIQRLDQHAFTTERRRLQLTQTLAASEIAGVELQQFRETGVLTFATPQELFDRDFPGHFLRLVKRIRVDVVALVPPTRRIRATLTAGGLSRAVVARGPFETVALRRDPETIAFTSPVGATGLFELQPLSDNGLLLPFEGMGVDAVWRLEMPKAANPFDFNQIADVLFTIDYTALHSDEHRERVIRRLGREFNGDRVFSVRNNFPDAWYAVNNPDTVPDQAARMRITLPLTEDDFPPHLEDLAVADLTLFVMWRGQALKHELKIEALAHGQDLSTGPVTTTRAVVSTRRPAGDPWRPLIGAGKSPLGDWEIRLPDDETVRSWFAGGLIEDVVLVMSLTATTPAWP
jgi:hypothetical protein